MTASLSLPHISKYIDLDSNLLALIHLMQMKTGKWFIKAVMLVTIFVKFGGILTAIQPEPTVCYCFCAQDMQD